MARSDGEPSDLERLSALLVRQAEISAEREERLATMMERLMVASPAADAAARPPPPAGGSSGTTRPRLPLSATPAPHLHAGANIREFKAWREKLSAYFMLTGVSALSITEQRAAIVGLLDDEWQRTLRYGLGVDDDGPLSDVLDAMEKHLRAQRNVVVDRRDFYARRQEPGERFDDFLCAVRESAAFCDFCKHCENDQIRDRIVCGASDDEAVRRMLETAGLTLQGAIDIGRACENARAACADIRGAPNTDVRHVWATGAAGGAPSPRGSGAARRQDPGRCQRCGWGEHSDPSWCRAAGAICRACGLRGHFAAVCRSAADTPRPPDPAGRRAGSRPHRRPTSYRRRSRSPSPSLRRSPSPPAPRVRSVIADVYAGRPTRPAPKVKVAVHHAAGRDNIQCTPDSGAEATVMGTETARSLGITDADLHTGPTDRFSAVGRHPLACRGSFRANIAIGPRQTLATVFVIDNVDGMLLSWFDSVALGLLPADFPAQVQSVAAPEAPPVPPPRRRHRRTVDGQQTTRPTVAAPPAAESDVPAGATGSRGALSQPTEPPPGGLPGADPPTALPKRSRTPGERK